MLGVVDGDGEEAGLSMRGGGCRGNASLGDGGRRALSDRDQSPWREFCTDEEPPASSCNSATVQVVSKLWARKTNTIDLDIDSEAINKSHGKIHRISIGGAGSKLIDQFSELFDILSNCIGLVNM